MNKKGCVCRPAGVTLIELIIAMAVIANLFYIVFLVYDVGFTLFQTGERRSELRADMGRAVYQLAKDVKLASGFTLANQNTVSFWIDYDGDGEESLAENITYSFSGVTGEALIKSDVSGDKRLLNNVVEFNLSYDSMLADSVHLVNFSLESANNFETLKIESSARARNII